jgi:malate dehydrogenase
MSSAAIFGAGPIGSAIAQRLAERQRLNDILLIDDNAGVAAGKALDLRQSGPIASSDTRLSGASDPLSAAGADVIVLADDTVNGAWDGDRGLGLIERLIRAGAGAPFVLAAPSQIPLMETAVRELHVAADRLVGTAASALEPIVASLLNIELGQTGARAGVTGRPQGWVIAWSAATIGGSLISDVVAPHRLAAISQSLSRLWPPGPEAIAAPTAIIIEALIAGSRLPLSAMTVLDGEFEVRKRAGLLPLELGRGRVLRRFTPSQSPQERNEMVTSLMRTGNS